MTDMTERVTVASKQFKILDIDFGKEVTERKELLAVASGGQSYSYSVTKLHN